MFSTLSSAMSSDTELNHFQVLFFFSHLEMNIIPFFFLWTNVILFMYD